MPAHELMDKARCIDVGKFALDARENVADQGNGAEVVERKKSRAQAIIDVMGVIGDVVGKRGDLRLGAGKAPQFQILTLGVRADRVRKAAFAIMSNRVARPIGERSIVLDQTLQRLPGEIQSIERGIAALQCRDHAQRLCVMVETARRRETAVERALAGMAEGRMAEIMGERQGLGQVLVESQGARQRARDLGDFEGVGEPGAVVIAFVKNEYLGFVRKPPKRGRVDDAVAVATERIARGAYRLGVEPATTPARSGRIAGARDCRFNRHGASVPIPKFAQSRGRVECELRNQRDTSNFMILVPLLNPKFANALAAGGVRTSGSRH